MSSVHIQQSYDLKANLTALGCVLHRAPSTITVAVTLDFLAKMSLVTALRAGRSSCGGTNTLAVTSVIAVQARGYAAPAKPAKKGACAYITSRGIIDDGVLNAWIRSEVSFKWEGREKEETGTAGYGSACLLHQSFLPITQNEVSCCCTCAAKAFEASV